MKIFPMLAISAGAASFHSASTFLDHPMKNSHNDWRGVTSWDDFLAILRTRYRDLELRQHDNSERFLRKSIMKMVRLMQRKKEVMERKGCWFSNTEVQYDMSLSDWNMCNIHWTLLADVQEAVTFFFGPEPFTTNRGQVPEHCKGITSRFEPFFNNYQAYFANKDMPSCP